MSLTDKIDSYDAPFVVAIIGGVLLMIVVVIGRTVTGDGGGPATDSVEACAEIENTERSVACFEAIGEDR